MDFSWLNAANDLVTAAVAIGGVIVAHKRGWIGTVVREIVHEGPRLLRDAEQVAEGVGQLVPAVTEAEQRLKDEIAQITERARQSELYHAASVGLHAFGVALGAVSEDQRKALTFWVAARVPGVTPDEISAALEAVQREADEAAASPLFAAATAFTQAQQQAQAQQTQPQAQQTA
ncbi:hypothetical protein [Alicyclobacillus macrosporangiidus]|nr:hypothetical protein [Alicyclobacillus macrosporangiidus]